MKEHIFISYCWENEPFKDKILSFVEFLRNNGFNANLDQNILQDETAPHFKEMMLKNLSCASKVIILLSPRYQKKANNFEGGVGIEYRYILEDIEINPTKYILCTLASFTEKLTPNAILPNGLSGRKIISLSDDSSNNYQDLFSCLMDFKPITLSPVNSTKPILTSKQITPFQPLNTCNSSPVIQNKNYLFSLIKKYLIENKQILMQYGPVSFIAKQNPLSDVSYIWQQKKLSTIIPNNSKIIELTEANMHLLSINEQELFYKFKEHASAFELSSQNRLDTEAVPCFPIDFENMINSGVL